MLGIILAVILALLAAPLAAEAQLSAPIAGVGKQSSKIHRVAYVSTMGSGVAQVNEPGIGAFVQQLRELGWLEGRNIVIEFRSAEASLGRASEIFAELVRQHVDVIVTSTNELGQAAMHATVLTPIVVTEGYAMVQNGLAVSLARPGGNVTGLEIGVDWMTGKRMQLLRQAAPNISRLAFLFVQRDPTRRPAFHPETLDAARTLGLIPVIMPAEPFPDRFGEAFAIRPKPDAVFLSPNIATYFPPEIVAGLLAQHRLPAMAWDRRFVDAGVLMSYGADNVHSLRRAAFMVDKILKGTKPADIPVERATKFELVINLKTAKALGLRIPPSLLLRADEVIE